MKKMEVKQMEVIAGGNSFWQGFGCGLGIAVGIAGGGLAGGPLGATLGGLGGVAACMML